ncbi:tetratricopeptide repeat protein [Methanofollis formosanus]|uniref:Tetratricopeptide repeat protein n=1 Tax=Methanofollis formosanus TaxID=299308 RepID=A0A8G1EFN8_9EURY|nr:hypothetical protein [Methanofollis formosanus]QYZ78062.1 tetratricopeptide repeat protein [Methanofollis formosanus]
MMLNTHPIRDFLWESYVIQADQEFLQSVQDLSHEEKRDRFIDHALTNQMLVRLKRDPGFAQYAFERVEESSAIQDRIRQKILLLFGETSSIPYSDPDVPGPKGLAEIVSAAAEKGLDPFEEAIRFSQDPFMISDYNRDRSQREGESKLRYLQTRLEAAEGRIDNDLEIIAIRQQMSDQASGLYYGPMMGVDDPLFPAAGFTDDILHAINRFSVQNLKFKGRYFASGDSALPDMSLMEWTIPILPFLTILEKAIFGKSVVDSGTDINVVRELWKFEADSSTIAAYEWFSHLSREEKIEILNGDYPFSIGEKYLSEIDRYVPENQSYYYLFRISQLYYAGFYEHAAKIGEHAFSHEKDRKAKYYIASSTATSYREYEDYQSALRWYETARKLTKKLEQGTREYKEFVERKNCAEMQHYLNGSERFRKDIAGIVKDTCHLPSEILSSIEYNLAEASRRTGEHDQEYEHLTEYVNLANPKDPHFSIALERLDLFTRTMDDPDFQTIRETESRKRVEIYQRRYRNAVLSFQYMDAMHWIECLLDIRPTPTTYSEKSSLLRHFGKNTEAIDLLRRAAELSDEGSYTKSFCWISFALLKARDTREIDEEVSEGIRSALCSAGTGNMAGPENGYIGILKPVIFDTTGWDDPALSTRFLKAFSREFSALGLPGNPALFIGQAYLLNSMSAEARAWFQRAAEGAESGSERAAIFNLIAESYFAEGDHESACKWFARATAEAPQSLDAHAGLARCHTCMMEYDRALASIKKACEIDPENDRLRQMEEEITRMSANVISLSRIDSEEVRSVFRTGDWLLYSVFTGPERASYDLGPVVIQYGKGVEKMLYETILLPIREQIRQDSRFCTTPGIGIRSAFWKGSDEKKIPALPFTLKTVLGTPEKSLALGQWDKLVSDIRKTHKNPLSLKFLNMMEEKGFSEEVINRIGSLCRDLSLERNGAAHLSFYSRDEVMEKRREMVTIINKIIGILSDLSE